MNLETRPTVEEIKVMFGLKPYPTCGFVAETYRSTLKIGANALPEAYGGDRPCGSALYFLVTPETQMVMHRIPSDQLYHHYLGDSLEVLLLYSDGNGEVVSVGSDLEAGERPQLFLPGALSTPRAWHRGSTTPYSRARSGPGWNRQTSSTETSRPLWKVTRPSAKRSAPSRVEWALSASARA